MLGYGWQSCGTVRGPLGIKAELQMRESERDHKGQH